MLVFIPVVCEREHVKDLTECRLLRMRSGRVGSWGTRTFGTGTWWCASVGLRRRALVRHDCGVGGGVGVTGRILTGPAQKFVRMVYMSMVNGSFEVYSRQGD